MTVDQTEAIEIRREAFLRRVEAIIDEKMREFCRYRIRWVPGEIIDGTIYGMTVIERR